jgi:hypothetical protein
VVLIKAREKGTLAYVPSSSFLLTSSVPPAFAALSDRQLISTTPPCPQRLLTNPGCYSIYSHVVVREAQCARNSERDLRDGLNETVLPKKSPKFWGM